MNHGIRYLFGLIFRGLYHIASFFIYIGEFTQKIFIYLVAQPKKFFLFLFQKIKGLLKFLKLIRLPAFSIKFPKLMIPRINLSFITTRVRYFALGVIGTLIVIGVWQGYVFVKELPSPYSIGKINYPVSSLIYDRNGKLLYEIYKSQNRTPVTLSQLPTYVVNSTVAIEDKDFYNHNGVALFSGVLRAIRETVVNRSLQGGSTITQQLVKSALLTPERTIERKAKEIILALWTERIYSKDKILEMYLNQVPYGGSSYGIQEAAKTYFGHDAKDLTLEEAALLAGLPQAPSVYSPYSNPKAAARRRNEVLQALEANGYIDRESRVQAQKAPVTVLPPKTSIKAPHFVFYVKSQLEDTYGISTVEEGGLRVTTTLDLDIQNEVEKILSEELEKIQHLNVNNGAVLVTRPQTGEIIAMVGSRDYFEDNVGAFNVTTALRQPGSSIKPIMYAFSLQKGFTAASIIDDSPTKFNIPGSTPYIPVNYDGKFHGRVPLRMALANSYNIPAVKTLEKIGVPDFIDFSEKLGISTWNDKSRYGLSLTLGGGEVTMVDMATAYGVLANNGYKIRPSYFLKIDGADGGEEREFHPFKIREVDPSVSYIISDILSDNFARIAAFGPNSALEIPGYKVAVKTGTTDSKKDNWTIGYTPDFLVTVWVGNNDNTPMNPYLSSGVTGAAPIWNRVMSYLLKNYSSGNQWYEQPENVVSKTCFFGRKEYFVKGTEDKINCGEKLGPKETPTPTPTP
jgi:1A family penicillin-binding protein